MTDANRSATAAINSLFRLFKAGLAPSGSVPADDFDPVITKIRIDE